MCRHIRLEGVAIAMKQPKRSNFYIDAPRMDALKQLAATEDSSISELVREGIDRVISDRMNNPRRERSELRANLEAFLQRFVKTGTPRSLEEIENIVTEASKKNAHTGSP